MYDHLRIENFMDGFDLNINNFNIEEEKDEFEHE